jgi:hypothetical protein
MTMANLIKRIAVSTSRRTGQAHIAEEFKSSSNLSSTGQKTGGGTTKRGSLHELASIVSFKADNKAPAGNQIKATQEITVTSEPGPWGRRGSEVEITGAYASAKANVPGVIIEETATPRSKSSASSMEIAESLKSTADVQKRPEESDDEAALVGKRGKGWGRLPG